MKTVWEKIEEINKELKKEFLCIPPYPMVTGKFVTKLEQALQNPMDLKNKVTFAITNPWQRAYQIEYRYKKAEIFKPFLTVIEYATYNYFKGDCICCYLSLLPTVEAVLRKWGELEPTLSFNKMRGFYPKLIEHLKQREQVYNDDRIKISENFYSYLEYMLGEILFSDFDKYEDMNFSEIFNRNLTLHRLKGIGNEEECRNNVIRLFLLLDIIAEVYLMKNPIEYSKIIFYTDPEENSVFQLRWKMYIKNFIEQIYSNDLMILEKYVINEADELDVQKSIECIKFKTIMLEAKGDLLKKFKEIINQ